MILESNIDERDLIEYCLNLRHSGYDYTFLLAFHGLANTWHFDKLIYYLNLIEKE